MSRTVHDNEGRTHAEEETSDSRSKVKLSPGLEEGDDTLQERDETLATESVRPVSYTHLTLPTILRV